MKTSVQIGREIRAAISETLRNVMLLAAASVTDATPVDTGHAASNWVLSTGTAYAGVDGSRQSVSHAAQDEGIRRIQSYEVGRDGKIFLRNNVLYMQFLDKGWSPQAEAGFVGAALQSASRAAPHGRKGSAKKILKGMSKTAYHRGY